MGEKNHSKPEFKPPSHLADNITLKSMVVFESPKPGIRCSTMARLPTMHYCHSYIIILKDLTYLDTRSLPLLRGASNSHFICKRLIQLCNLHKAQFLPIVKHRLGQLLYVFTNPQPLPRTSYSHIQLLQFRAHDIVFFLTETWVGPRSSGV